MFDQLFENFRKASESSLQAQQEMFKRWFQQWPSVPMQPNNMGDWSEMQKRWIEAATEAMDRHRNLLDVTYKSGIDVIGQAFRMTEARSPDDYRRLMEELWRKLSDAIKAQSETQLREFQSAADRWVERAQSYQQPSTAS